MSPLLRNRLLVTLGPTQITITKIQRGWNPKAAESIVIDVALSEAGNKWAAPILGLQTWLEKEKFSATNLMVIVSDSFTRYGLLPWVGKLTNHSELMTLAHIHFNNLYGPPSANWIITADKGEYEKARIGCALDQTLITSIGELCKVSRLKLVSLQPNFMQVYNHWRLSIGVDALFGVLEPDQCVLASLKNGHWHSIRTIKFANFFEVDVSQLMEREILLQGLSAQVKRYLHSGNFVLLEAIRGLSNITILESQDGSNLSMFGES
ncbi:MAG: hypothetical protein Q7T66_05540 [Herminiimonas sp.]|uniref:hypothetical protein n=1 Tax=Herminiimonas sp. TaxID=1926289 RepID=UPI00271A39BF|nr:hypothetical protein [Herminiimonas sp.]MDO9420110.1 hypothetical protein [Herminiimonas sp.]